MCVGVCAVNGFENGWSIGSEVRYPPYRKMLRLKKGRVGRLVVGRSLGCLLALSFFLFLPCSAFSCRGRNVSTGMYYIETHIESLF